MRKTTQQENGPSDEMKCIVMWAAVLVLPVSVTTLGRAECDLCPLTAGN